MALFSIVIPVYNEKSTIVALLDKVESAALPEGLQKQIILVDDFSTDGTREVLKGVEGRYKIIYHAKNSGKGAAVRTGLNAASGDYAIIQDADLEYDPGEYGKLLMPLIRGEADVVYGSRFLGNTPHGGVYYRHFLGNKFLTWFSNLFTGLKLTDMETCYKVFGKTALSALQGNLTADRFGVEPEITAKVKKFRIVELPISYHGREFKEGKKIKWTDGLAAMYFIVKFNVF